MGLLQNFKVQGGSLEDFTEKQVTKTDQEETIEDYNGKTKIKTNADNSNHVKNRNPRYIDRAVSCINGDQLEIDR